MPDLSLLSWTEINCCTRGSEGCYSRGVTLGISSLCQSNAPQGVRLKASDNQSPTPSLLVWLKNKPGGTASTDRRRGEGE